VELLALALGAEPTDVKPLSGLSGSTKVDFCDWVVSAEQGSPIQEARRIVGYVSRHRTPCLFLCDQVTSDEESILRAEVSEESAAFNTISIARSSALVQGCGPFAVVVAVDSANDSAQPILPALLAPQGVWIRVRRSASSGTVSPIIKRIGVLDLKHLVLRGFHLREWLRALPADSLVVASEWQHWAPEARPYFQEDRAVLEGKSVPVWRKVGDAATGAEESNFLPIHMGGKQVGVLHPARAWLRARNGSVLRVAGESTIVEEGFPNNPITVRRRLSTDAVETAPVLDAAMKDSDGKVIKVGRSEENTMSVYWYEKQHLSETLSALLQRRVGERVANALSVSVAESNKRDRESPVLLLRGIHGGKAFAIGHARTLAGLLKRYLQDILPPHSDCVVQPIAMTTEEFAVLITHDGEPTDEPISTLKGLIFGRYVAVLEHLYRRLSNCPCIDGCEGCVYVLPWSPPFEKTAVMLWLGTLAGHGDKAVKLVKQRAAVTDADVLKKLFNSLLCTDGVIRGIWGDALILEPTVRASVHFMTPDEKTSHPNAIGLYYSQNQDIGVQANMSEVRTLSVVAHEYAHNWQWKSNRWQPPTTKFFGGRLYLEGFAEWVAYKVMEKYCAFDEMRSLDLRTHDEYGEGLDVFLYLEEKFGVNGVLEFASGAWQTRKEFEPEVVLRESNLFAVIEAKSGSPRQWHSDTE